MTPQQALDILADFIDKPSESDDRQADAIEAVGTLQRYLDSLSTDSGCSCGLADKGAPGHEEHS